MPDKVVSPKTISNEKISLADELNSSTDYTDSFMPTFIQNDLLFINTAKHHRAQTTIAEWQRLSELSRRCVEPQKEIGRATRQTDCRETEQYEKRNKLPPEPDKFHCLLFRE